MNNPLFLKHETVKFYGSPGVYLAFEKDEVVYVGQSKNGICRPILRDHHILKDIINFDLLFIPIEDSDDLTVLECTFIRIFKPRLNKQKSIYLDYNLTGGLRFLEKRGIRK